MNGVQISTTVFWTLRARSLFLEIISVFIVIGLVVVKEHDPVHCRRVHHPNSSTDCLHRPFLCCLGKISVSQIMSVSIVQVLAVFTVEKGRERGVLSCLFSRSLLCCTRHRLLGQVRRYRQSIGHMGCPTPTHSVFRSMEKSWVLYYCVNTVDRVLSEVLSTLPPTLHWNNVEECSKGRKVQTPSGVRKTVLNPVDRDTPDTRLHVPVVLRWHLGQRTFEHLSSP